MVNILRFNILIILFLSVFTTCVIRAENTLHLGINAGLALPNSTLSQFYNDAKQTITGPDSLNNVVTYFKDVATNRGYTLNIKGYLQLSDYFEFVPSIGIIRLNGGTYDLKGTPYQEIKDTILAKVNSMTNIIPISVGINGYLFHSFISIYGTANVCYNYTIYSQDVVWQNYPSVPIGKSEPVSRIGYGLGCGIEFDLSLVSLCFEATYNTHNIIGRETNEPLKSFGTITIGVIF